jgi:microcystin-dependent protein
MIIDHYGNRRFYGTYRGLVVDNNDPLGKKRVRLKIPQVLFDQITDWSWGVFTAGVEYAAPSVGQGVFVTFEGGDPSFPIWTDKFTSDGSVDYLQLNPSYDGGSTQLGMLTWDADATTPQVKVGNGDVTLQIGQEFHVVVGNDTGADIPNGTVVCFNGSLGPGGHPTVRPYLADGARSAFTVVGITTQVIPNNGEGLVTSKGVIHDLDTSSYSVGDVLYASPLISGKLTNVKPTPPDETVVVGVATYISSTTGQIYATVSPVIQQLNTSISLYQTNATSDISGYFKAVNSQTNASYNSTAVIISKSFTSGNSVGSSSLVGSWVADANLFIGNPGPSITVTTSGNIRKTSGNNNTSARFYFNIYKRAADGTETLLGSSANGTGPIANTILNTWQQFSSSTVANLGYFTNTDRIVVKLYGYVAQSGNQSYDLQLGGLQPYSTVIPVPVSVVSTSPAYGVSTDVSLFNGNLSSADTTVQKALNTLDDIPLVRTTDSGTVSTTMLADSSVTSAKIANGAIATVDIADGAVTSAKIADGAIATLELADASVTYAKIQNVSAQYRIHGRISAGAGVTEELTPDNLVTVINQGTTSVTVPHGGTGVTSFTSGAYLKGAGTSAITTQTGIPGADINTNQVGSAFGGVPTGAVFPFAGTTAPSGYLLCDGTAVSRTTYSALFAVTSTTYGVGDGSTTFNTPDLRTRVPVGKNSTGTFNILGKIGGEETVTLTSSQIPAHSHSFKGGSHTWYWGQGATTNSVYIPSNPGVTAGTPPGNEAQTSQGIWNSTSDNTGGGSSHNNLQPYITLNYIIKT